MIDKKIKQLSIVNLLVLVFFPAFLILMTYLWSIQFRETIPPFLSFMVIILVVLIPIELGIILNFSKKENGKLNLQSAFIEHEKLLPKQIIGISIVLIVFAALVFTVISPIEHNFMFKTIFGEIPEYFKLSYFFNNYKNYSKSIIAISLVLYIICNGILGPIVEELYFRGLIMPRINRFGNWTPVIIAILFSAYHLFSPWEFITRIIACFPFVYCVYKKKNIYIGMVVHCILNMASAIIAITSLLSNSGFWQRI
ncbi:MULTISPECIES: type II CAAX endopeptidase family protein [unclassified Clostridium]|uniref:CPBP family intramembrane glutamic endopeptidase n=1 Tax=unclassified Clostridium TaxID=2614128 RepID=UPI000297F274|nr:MULTISPECIES: type II CAAX endopeptidase family protein [unclassified Clostridium]EKQ51439.1 MAG: CAAX amino terminal protease family [Clostridium sp. Maddingley MBC34-26]